jgi:hypothetical protein
VRSAVKLAVGLPQPKPLTDSTLAELDECARAFSRAISEHTASLEWLSGEDLSIRLK